MGMSYYWVRHVKADPIAYRKGYGLLIGGAQLFRFLWLTPGTFRKATLDWADYFKPNFHPWQHKNAHHLKELDGFSPTSSEYNIPATAY